MTSRRDRSKPTLLSLNIQMNTSIKSTQAKETFVTHLYDLTKPPKDDTERFARYAAAFKLDLLHPPR